MPYMNDRVLKDRIQPEVVLRPACRTKWHTGLMVALGVCLLVNGQLRNLWRADQRFVLKLTRGNVKKYGAGDNQSDIVTNY